MKLHQRHQHLALDTGSAPPPPPPDPLDPAEELPPAGPPEPPVQRQDLHKKILLLHQLFDSYLHLQFTWD